MRKFLPAVFLLFSLRSLISQNLNIAGHEGVDKTGEIISINSKVFYFGSEESYCCGRSIYLMGMDAKGDTIFKIGLPGSYRYQYFGRIIKTNDNAILVNHYALKACDLGAHFDYITKIDTNGAILFSVPIQGTVVTSGVSGTIRDVTQHLDNSYYLVSSTDLYHYSAAGQLISKITTSLTNIYIVKALANGNLFVSGKLNSVNTNVILSPSGVILKQQPCTNQLVKLIEAPPYFYARTMAGTLEKYDTSLVVLSTFNSPPYPSYFSVNDFTMRNDSIFITGNKGPGGDLYYAILDNYLNIKYQFQSYYKGTYPTGIAVTNTNGVNVVATCKSKQVPVYTFNGFYQFRIGSGFYSGSDIGVTGFSNLNTNLNINQGGPVTPDIEMDVKVQNFGMDTVKSFYLNYYAKYTWCYILFHKKCEVTINPGASVTIPTGSFYGQPGLALDPGGASQKLNICIFTTVPNAGNDIDIDNDAFCDSVLFTVTGLKENAPLAQSIHVFPNPSSEGFNIGADVEIKTLEVVNSLGELINQEIINAKDYYLNAITLKPGIYFIRLETEKGIVQKKIIKN